MMNGKEFGITKTYGMVFLSLLLTSMISIPNKTLGTPLQYEDIPKLIQEKNERVLASAEIIDATESRTGFLKRSFIPQVYINGGFEHFKTRDFPQSTQPFGGAEASLNLYRGGRDQLEEEKRQTEVSIAKVNQENIFREELFKARELFWNLAYQKEWINSLNEILTVNKKNRKTTALLVSKGLMTDTDLLGFDLFQSQTQEMIRSSKIEVNLLEAKLKTQLGIAQNDFIKISLPKTQIHQEYLQNKPKPNAAHLKAQLLREEAKKEQIHGKKYSRQWTPKIDAFGLYQLYTERERDSLEIQNRQDLAAGLRLQLHVFDGFQAKHEATSSYQKAMANKKLANYQENLYHTELRTVQEDIKKYHHLFKASKNFQQQTQLWLHKTLEDLQLGQKSSLDVLAVTKQLLDLKKEQLNYLLNFRLSQAKASSLLGE